MIFISVSISDFVEDYFDMGICQAVRNEDGKLWSSDAFDIDICSKTISVFHRGGVTQSNSHIGRVQSKYPDYTIRHLHDPSREFLDLQLREKDI